jgi:diaminohydroxyphosphoribosylaminopyrimidine deaminase/5-amino-6-(5-phosphoribosylamino)uracil reductase
MNKEALAEKDEAFMALACKLAARGRGRTRPNPMVGAVLVRRGKAFSTGYHRRPGAPHAEVVAIDRAKEPLAGATLYVNLEPCAHYGRTPPCVDLILQKKIRRVVIGTKDTNPLVNGKSIATLRRKGVQVTCGVLEEKCRRLNETFFKHVETNKPFVTLKAALTLDGKIASSSGQSQWISCPASRKKVHRLRSRVDAILVGVETVLQDDPQLTVRGVRTEANPCRVVMDSRLRTPMTARVLEPEAETLLATTDGAPARKIRQLEKKGIRVEVFRPDRTGRVPLGRLLRRLGKRGMQHVLLEGGAGLYTTALMTGEVDKLLLFVAPLLLGGKDAPSLFDGTGFSSPKKGIPVRDLEWRRSDRDLMLEAYCSGEGMPGAEGTRKPGKRT